MLGKQQITIASTQTAAGLCTSDYMGDGGLGTSSYNLSLIATPGVVRAMPAATPTGTVLATFLASCEDPETNSALYDRFFLDSSGNIYTFDGTGFSTSSSLSPSGSFSISSTDMAAFRNDGTSGFIYATSTVDIGRVAVANANGALTTISSWWVGTKTQGPLKTAVPHPLIVYEGFLWIADNNQLHTVDSSETIATGVLTLSTNERIQALGIDPQTGLMMVAVSTSTTSNNRASTRNFVYLYDGITSKPRRKIPVDGVITNFHNVNGTVFIGMDNTIGYWNGNGVTFLRRLYNVSENNGDLPKKVKMTSFQNTLLVVDGKNVLAFGDIGNGKKVWWPFYQNQVNSNYIDFIAFAGNDHNANTIPLSPNIIVVENTNARKVTPMATSTAATGVLYTNNIYFERPVHIRGVRVFTTGITTTAGIGGVSIIDDTNTTRTPAVSTFVVPSANSPKYWHDFLFDFKTQTIQPKITIDTQAFGFIRAVIYYDVAE